MANSLLTEAPPFRRTTDVPRGRIRDTRLMKQLAIAATATLAIVTIAGLTGTGAARAQIAKAVQVVEHPAGLRSAFTIDPSVMAQICATRPGALDVIVDVNGHPVYAPNADRARNC